MSFAVLACALLALQQPLQGVAPSAPDFRSLRWVRATVSAFTPESLTLQLKDRDVILNHDRATEIVGPHPPAGFAVGAVVEAHYLDRDGERRAIVILTNPGPGTISKRPGTSVRGHMVRFGRGTLWVGSPDRTRDLAVQKKSRLIDREGRALATGSPEIGKRLSPNDDLLVKIEGSPVMLGNLDLGGDSAVEIRRLR